MSQECGGQQKQSEPRGAQLTRRDRQIIGYLAVARYLSTEQIQRLTFPGRDVQGCRRRLLRLAGLYKNSGRAGEKQGRRRSFEIPYLRTRKFRTFDGEVAEAWALTEPGYLVAEELLRTTLRI